VRLLPTQRPAASRYHSQVGLGGGHVGDGIGSPCVTRREIGASTSTPPFPFSPPSPNFSTGVRHLRLQPIALGGRKTECSACNLSVVRRACQRELWRLVVQREFARGGLVAGVG